jgi:hypothetical protein
VKADYLIGCDGVASAMRAQMIGDALRFLGLTAIYGDAPIRSSLLGSPFLDSPCRGSIRRSGSSAGAAF